LAIEECDCTDFGGFAGHANFSKFCRNCNMLRIKITPPEALGRVRRGGINELNMEALE
jgi:hypothetical protein